VVVAAITVGEILTPLFFYVVIAAYIAFVLASAWQFSRRPEPGRTMRFINLTLVPLGVLVALVGVLAASFNAFSQQEGTPSTIWAIVMVALGLGGSSLLLAAEGFVLRARVQSSSPDRRAIGLRSLSLIATTVPLVVLGMLFVALALRLPV
jgi:small-conductance mechanosensitive channel